MMKTPLEINGVKFDLTPNGLKLEPDPRMKNPEGKISTWGKKGIPLEVKGKLPKQLKNWGFKIPDGDISSNTGKARFKAVVESVHETLTASGDWGEKLAKNGRHSYEDFDGIKIADRSTIQKFIEVAKVAELGKIDRKTPDDPTAKTQAEIEAEQQLSGFARNQKVVNWQESPSYADKGQENVRRLWRVAILMNLTPEQIVQVGSNKSSSEKIKWIEDRITKEKTFEAGGKWKNKVPDISAYEWMYGAPEFKYVMNPPLKDKKGIAFAKPRSDAYVKGSRSILKEHMKVLKHFMQANEISFLPAKKGSLWDQRIIKPSDTTAKLKMKAQELIDFDKCLEDGATIGFDKKGIKIVIDTRLKHKKGKKKGQAKEYETTKEDWYDAYFYYRLAMELGFRAEEGFTAVGNKPFNQDIDSGVIELGRLDDTDDKGTGDMKVQILTRKTAHVDREKHAGFILSEKTKKMIRDKKDHIESAMKKSVLEAEKMGVQKLWINPDTNKEEEYPFHAMIGTDGKYTAVGTMQLPSRSGKRESIPEKEAREARKESRGIVSPVNRTRLKMRAIMRHCYSVTFKDKDFEKYWNDHSLHSLRHVFAQDLIKTSHYDYAWVAQWGHWGGVEVLQKFYGAESDEDTLRKAKNFKRNTLEHIAEEEKEIEDMSDEEKEKIEKNVDDVLESTMDQSTITKPNASESDAKLEDKE